MAIVVFGVGQLILPGLAAQSVRARLSGNGRVLNVSVSAFPAVELLFGDADRVTVSMASYRGGESELASRIQQSSGVSELTVHVAQVRSGLLTLDAVTVTKHGAELQGSGTLTEANLRAAIPFLQSVSALGDADGGVVLRGRAQVPFLGDISADALVTPRSGRLVVSGVGLLGSFLHLTVFASPHLHVESITGRPVVGGLFLSARARQS
ncbi:MAG TPA: LmeA family phospholipid-binding protein [Solirubrobacteraceae bacterium]|nr:LmeA family phospholipid-binding protein [Solirubrobacteraceae bacterium]